MTKFIEAQNVVKFYGKKKVLKNISLEVTQGAIFGLLGPNGAGKTTFVKSLLNLTKISEGQILIKGTSSHLESARQNLAYLPEKFSFFPYYSIKGTLLFFGKMYGLPPGRLEENMEEVLKKLNLSSIADQKLNTLSKGQMQRVGLAKLLMGDAGLLILDEPFSGLDPIGIRELKDLILQLGQEGKTIFLNSHILSEVEQICDEVAILKEGEILARGKVKTIQKTSRLEDFFMNAIKGG